MSKVSIIIPAYNQARFLGQAIASALGQEQAEVEVIVVDDGSTDDTPAVVATFADNPNLKSIRQPNTGLPGARNRGLAEATGDYVCFLDSDDYYAPAKAARQARMLDENPALGFVYCDIITVDPSGQPLPDQFSLGRLSRPLSGNIFQSLMEGGYFPPHAVMIRRGILAELGGFDPALGGHADYELWLRVSGAGHPTCYQDEPLAFYRTHPDSMSKDGLHMQETRVATFAKIARLHPDAFAAGLNHLQQSAADSFQANQVLWQAAEQARGVATETRTVNGSATSRTYSFLQHLPAAKILRGQPDQTAIWETTLDGRTSKAIYLQPPAELVFRLPTGARGLLSTAVAIHPDAWTKPEAGGCEFHLRADGRLAYVLAIDPARLPTDRHWHEIKFEVPENPAGVHDLTLETKSIGPKTFRWALWRNPTFTGVAEAALNGRSVV